MIPGARRVSMYAVPSPSGNWAICLASMRTPEIPLFVLSSGASARTVTVSSTVPVASVMSMRTVSDTATCCPSRTKVLKPESVAVTLYLPGLR